MSPNADLLHRLFPGLTLHLDTYPGIKNLKYNFGPPATRTDIFEWESEAGREMPRDLASIFFEASGFELEWSAATNGEEMNVGRMNLMPLASIAPFSESSTNRASLPSKFLIEKCGNYGDMYLVYTTSIDTEFQFLSCAGEWTTVASSYTQYFRLMVVFLGIKGWQLHYSASRWPKLTRNLMCFYLPMRASQARSSKAKREFANVLNRPDEPNSRKKDMWEKNGIPSDSYNWWMEREHQKPAVSNFSLDHVLKIVQSLTVSIQGPKISSRKPPRPASSK